MRLVSPSRSFFSLLVALRGAAAGDAGGEAGAAGAAITTGGAEVDGPLEDAVLEPGAGR